MENMIQLKIDDIAVSVPEGTTVLEAAKLLNINIPTLCYLKDINEIGACRMCLVEIKGARALQASCVYPVAEGIEVYTNSPSVRKTRKANLELILSDHKRECTTCVRSENCELQSLSKDLGIKDVRFEGAHSADGIEEIGSCIVRDESKCIYCKRCIAVCNEVQGIGALGAVGRGFTAKAQPVFGMALDDVNCIKCGQCIINCPVGALSEKPSIDEAWAYINDSDIHAVAIIAPAVRAAIGESFGNPIGTDTTGKMVTAAKRLGFDKVFDVNFAADVTILEEGTELINRIKNNGSLPLITSCSPGWINYCEKFYPDQLSHLSSCKSPQNMNGALLKSHYAQINGIDPKKIKVISVMPCTAKKSENIREQLSVDGLQDVDVVITTREFADMIKQAGIEYNRLGEGDFDEFYGDGTGAAVIFGATGGVMEAALRTALELITGKESEKVDYPEVRGIEGIKEFSVKAGDLTLKAAVVSGGANIKKMMDRIAAGEADYQFVEMMACPGGCVNGGGQPIVSSGVKSELDVRTERAKVLYDRDKNVAKWRKSHENPSVQKLYKDFLGEPNGHLSHKLLHTHYSAQVKYNK